MCIAEGSEAPGTAQTWDRCLKQEAGTVSVTRSSEPLGPDANLGEATSAFIPPPLVTEVPSVGAENRGDTQECPAFRSSHQGTQDPPVKSAAQRPLFFRQHSGGVRALG